MTNFKTRRLLLIAAVTLAARGDTCVTEVISDPSFDMWCGDTLCNWDLDAGTIERVPTWHESDFGVALTSDPTIISQVSNTSADCFEFELIADVESNTSIFLEMDYFDDGIVDQSEQIPSAPWELLTMRLTAPERYNSVRFRIRKSGGGRAVLAQIRALGVSGCAEPPLSLINQPDGAHCDTGGPSNQCLNAFCVNAPVNVLTWGSATCSACATDGDCAGGSSCGIAPAAGLAPSRQCVPDGTAQLGHLCASDAECRSGICEGDVCAQCRGSSDCGGNNCVSHDYNELGTNAVAILKPKQCQPTAGAGGTGAPCLRDTDCGSAACTGSGEIRVCTFDNRQCSSDADCLGECLPLGVADGTCD